MHIQPEAAPGPYQFTQQDMEIGRLRHGAEHTLADFYQWRDTHPSEVADHIAQYTEQLENHASSHALLPVVGRYIYPPRHKRFQAGQMTGEIGHFEIINLGQITNPEVSKRVGRMATEYAVKASNAIDSIGQTHLSVTGLAEVVERQFPVLNGASELEWLKEQFDRLYRILPEVVIQAGGMGKVARTMLGVLAIGAYDTFDDTPAAQKEHLAKVLPAAYAYGATYPIIDDTLQDMPGNYISPEDKERYHQAIVKGLATGDSTDIPRLPDYPLAQELQRLYDIMTELYPAAQHRHLYDAAESMYIAQHIDAQKTVEAVQADGLPSMYPDLFIKASMSRVVANILGRRALDDSFYTRCVNTTFVGQLRDDLGDRHEDTQAGRVTPFTYPPDKEDANPLYDLFAYDAYVADQVLCGDPQTKSLLTQFGATRLAAHIASRPPLAEELMREYVITDEMAQFMLAVSALSPRAVRNLDPIDVQIRKSIGKTLRNRKQTEVDPQTFVADRLEYINKLIQREAGGGEKTGLGKIVEYALDTGGKRLRPALTLMLAEGLGVDYRSVESLLVATELFHTSSLLFDDLPAQDNAKLRRGKPAAHTIFDEGRVQLAAISMMSSGFGEVAELRRHYPAERVAETIQYVGSVLGPERLCRGQDLDLQMEKASREGVTADAIIEMYSLKTSTMIEAALVPLMMLTDRPAGEIQLVKEYSYHAGIVFQIKDDILDMTSDAGALGKDAGNDINKINIVRAYGLDEAWRRMQHHLDGAVTCCEALPFNTNLLQGIVCYFADRHK